MKFINVIRKFINPINLDLKIYPNLDLRRRKKLLEHHKISKIFDVGANKGQYASQIFDLSFKGQIISFEPVKSTFVSLKNKTKSNKNWNAFNFGLGNKNEKVEINLSQNTHSSSLLDILPTHVKSAPDSKTIGVETVTIKTLDFIFNELVNENDIVLLKIDVQGFEKKVLDGAKESLSKIKGIQLEMSIEELYKGEMLFLEMITFLKSVGFNLQSLENGFYNEASGKLLQVDGLFFKD
ncbi:MAG: FkbM family methyltransferase [Polaribacter sp.]|jgi:FkbM family methyltransferase|nr:FkbM family methyltransferase [Polaribacter sp.]MDG1528397.1 FkbM family methyltransferase [Polaribacter sp.]MDG1954894.1 FkbM family methyltransferase [Polaribacter sp.]MDG2074592.1 FkbM family methyltransferase [Polaribacter sp.]